MSRSRIKEKIAALRSKTKANGCTEAEAVAAAEMAARLMAGHGLSEAEMEMGEAAGSGETVRPTWRTKLGATIAICTNCSSIVLDDGPARTTMLFVGRAPGPEIAVYLREVCIRSVDAELRRFKAGTFYRRRRSPATRRQAAADFVDGMVERLSRRLFDLFRSTVDRAVIGAAKSIINARFQGAAAHPLQVRAGRFADAAHAGWKAGGSVALNHGVRSDECSATPLLGRGEG